MEHTDDSARGTGAICSFAVNPRRWVVERTNQPIWHVLSNFLMVFEFELVKRQGWVVPSTAAPTDMADNKMAVLDYAFSKTMAALLRGDFANANPTIPRYLY